MKDRLFEDTPVSFEISKVKLFDGIDISDVESLLDTVLLEAGSVLCRKGDQADCLWIIAEGEVRIGPSAQLSNVQIVRKVGDVVGEQGILTEDIGRYEDMTATMPCRLISLSRSAIATANEDLRRRLILNIARILGDKLRETTDLNFQHIARVGEAKTMLDQLVNPDGFDLNTGHLRRDYQHVEAVIWFSDIVGFSKAANKLKPRAVGKILREVLSIQSDAIKSKNGFVDKFQGDGIMAYWPVRSSKTELRRDAVTWALDAAEKSWQAVRKLRDPTDRRRKLDLRIGLHLGIDNVIRGNFGSSDRFQWTLIGNDVNIAAGLEHAKSDGLNSIRLSQSFCRLVSEERLAPYKHQAVISTKSGDIHVHTGPA